MPSTVTTKEIFDGDIKKERMEKEVEIRLKAGAIKSKFKKEGDHWVLSTQWNVIGEQ